MCGLSRWNVSPYTYSCIVQHVRMCRTMHINEKYSSLFFYILIQESLDALFGSLFKFFRIKFEAGYLGEHR